MENLTDPVREFLAADSRDMQLYFEYLNASYLRRSVRVIIYYRIFSRPYIRKIGDISSHTRILSPVDYKVDLIPFGVIK
jgi:hypothetical protein